MTTRRRFIEIMPLAGVGLLAACNKPVAPAAPAVVAAPAAVTAPAATPSAAPATPMPTPAPAPLNPAAGVAGGLAMVDEKDANSLALGYVSDAKRADVSKFKAYAEGQSCASCALFAGKAGDDKGACPLYAGRQVAAIGWCSAYSKKA